MTDYCKQVKAAIQATTFHSPTSYAWFGRRSHQLSSTIKRALTPETARSYLLFNLQSQLYQDFYCQGFARPARQEGNGIATMGITPFVKALSTANSGRGYWQAGWEVHSINDDEVAVKGENLELWAQPVDCLVPQGSPITQGMRLSLRFPKEFLGISPGFYMALSDEASTREDEQNLVRIYWNLTAEGAIPFIRHITSMLNRAHLPFKLKVLNDPVHFTRCDAGVLYLCKRDYAAVSKILERLYPAIAASLKPGIPAFTKQLAAGIGLAEGPAAGESFGFHHCYLLADGMIRAYEQGKKLIDERLQVVVDCLAEAEISLEKPFLKPGSCDTYNFHPRLQERRLSHQIRTVSQTNSHEEVFLRIANYIGQRLSQEAVWYQDRCNWLGFEQTVLTPMNRVLPTMYKSLGPDLYSGTSGVALFLAELYAIARENVLRRTALGAIRQALWCLENLPPPNRLGLYTGWIGVAYVAARLGAILDEEGLLERARQLLKRIVDEHQDENGVDLLSGRAGAIAALVVLQDIVDGGSLLDFAMRLGDELLQTADRSDVGYSWKSATRPKQRNLTGFSHGTAGIGYALLELFHATGDVKYYKVAEQAFHYERYWFDSNAGNWPDFREEPARGKRGQRPLSFATYWCHGAPGIALSRLRSYKILNNETCRAEAITGVQTTRKMLEKMLHSGMGNFSLCHGLTGNAEVLLIGSQVLGQELADALELALEVANIGIKTYAVHGNSWPCGTDGGKTPNLMLGLAGIGYFYLRLHNPTTPSILILERENFLSRPQ
jgi:hypothetical protein